MSSTYFIYRIQTVSSGESSTDSDILSSIFKGIKYIYTNSLVFIIILTVAVHCALVMSYESILPIFSQEALSDSSGEFLGYLIMFFGAGSLVGNLMLSSAKTTQRKSFLFLLSSVGSGVFPILLGCVVFIPSVYSFYLSMIGIFFIGASQASFMSVTTTMVQKIVPDGIRGRIMSLYLLHAGGIMAFGNLILGSLADYIDYSTLFIFTGIAFLVYFLFMFITQKKFRTDIISII